MVYPGSEIAVVKKFLTESGTRAGCDGKPSGSGHELHVRLAMAKIYNTEPGDLAP